MPERVQPIYSDSPGAIANAVYELPAGLDLELFSVRARVSGAAAAASFIVVCEVLTQDGRIMAQSEIEQTLAVGDTGALTWAPFLRSAAAATPAGSFTAQFITRRNDLAAQSIVSGTGWTRCDFSPGSTVNSDATRFAIGSFNPDTTEVKLTGFYLVRGVVVWAAGFNADHGLMLNWSHTTWGDGNSFSRSDAQVGFGAGSSIVQPIRLPGGTSDVSLYVYQTSGANKTISDMYLTIHYLADYQGQPANSDPF